MPTGYTAGILDGTTTDFKQFAKLCSRAFMIHLRDEPFNSEYKERKPSDYHLKAINKAKKALKQIDLLSDDEIITQEKNRLIESKKYHLKSKEKDEKSKIKMEQFLKEAKLYKAPTDKHIEIGKFMVDQLEKTIDFDCSSDYHTEALIKIDENIQNINANDIRANVRVDATKKISYHTKENESELKRCRESNKWYNDFLTSVDG